MPRSVPPRPAVLVSLDWLREGDPPFGLGAASIASSLRSYGSHVRIVTDAVNRPEFSMSAFLNRVSEAISEAGARVLVGIGAFVWCEPEVQTLLRVLCPKADVVLGGPQISYAWPGRLEQLYPGARYFVRGNGEFAMVLLAAGHAENGLHGIHVAGMPDLCTRADFPLDGLPSPHLDGTSPISGFVRWETQRGCQFACTFCQHRQPGARLLNSNLATGRLRREMAAFRDAGTCKVAVLDPIFNTDVGRAVDLLGCLKETRIGAHLSLQCRFELVTDAFLDAVEPLDATLEFGLQTVHDDEARAVGRPNHMGSVESAIAKLNRRRIPYEVSLIYGLPFQTAERFRDSVNWCLERGVPKVRAWPLMLLRGTKIHTEREKWGYVESVGERIPIVVESRWFSRGEHSRMADIASSLT
ncbi:MAG: B12-binding domain-containing radical SAM protein [Thaumarchaeota archaeon]|nr:B12-binding domain-containing radical SAM protein [Nitrososphaerota archaeon]